MTFFISSHNWPCRLARIALLFILAAPYAAGASTATPKSLLIPRSEVYPLAGHLEMLADKSGALTFGDVLNGENAGRFRPIAGFLNRGYTDEATWVRFALRRDTSVPHDFFLRLGPSMLDRVSVYVQTGDNPSAAESFREYILGDHHPVALRPVRHSSFVVPIVLPDGKPRSVYIRVRTTSTHELKGWIYSPEEFIFWSELRSLLNGGFFGIVLVVAFINAIYALRLRDMLYGYYSLYVLTLFASYLGVEGILPLFWPAGAHLVSDYLTGFGTGFGFASFALFAIRLFDTRGKLPFAHRYFQFTFLLGVAVCISIPLNVYGRLAPLLLVNGLFFVFYLTWLGIQLLRRRMPAGSLFLTAFMASNIGAILVCLRLLGLVPVTWLTTYSLQVGAVLSMVLMTLALTERVHAAEEKALAASRDAEQRAVGLANEMTRELQEKQRELLEALATERDALERQVRFVEMVSHEYRTPLAIIRANLDILEIKDGKGDRALHSNLSKMKRAVARLVEVLEVSLGRERVADQRMQMNRAAIPVSLFIRELLDEAGELWGNRRLELSLRDGGTVAGDRLLLKTAFLNLIDNALKYSAEDEPVSVAVHTEGDAVVVAVRDRGRGIPADERGRVFEKYFRGAGSSETKGAGIGLYLVQRIIAQHGGFVSLAGGEPVGTVVTVRLPLSHPQARPDDDAGTESAQLPVGNR